MSICRSILGKNKGIIAAAFVLVLAGSLCSCTNQEDKANNKSTQTTASSTVGQNFSSTDCAESKTASECTEPQNSTSAEKAKESAGARSFSQMRTETTGSAELTTSRCAASTSSLKRDTKVSVSINTSRSTTASTVASSRTTSSTTHNKFEEGIDLPFHEWE